MVEEDADEDWNKPTRLEVRIARAMAQLFVTSEEDSLKLLLTTMDRQSILMEEESDDTVSFWAYTVGMAADLDIRDQDAIDSIEEDGTDDFGTDHDHEEDCDCGFERPGRHPGIEDLDAGAWEDDD